MSSLSEGSLVMFSSTSSRNCSGLKFFRHLILGLLFGHAVNVRVYKNRQMIRYVKKSDANIIDFLFINDICVNVV